MRVSHPGQSAGRLEVVAEIGDGGRRRTVSTRLRRGGGGRGGGRGRCRFRVGLRLVRPAELVRGALADAGALDDLLETVVVDRHGG